MSQFETSPPAPPWNLRGGALIFLQRASTRKKSARAAFAEVWPSLLPRVLALVHYADSPVGSYDERAVAVLTRRGPSIVEMQVNLENSRRGGRENWGYPKTLAALSWCEYSQGENRGVSRIEFRTKNETYRARVLAPSLPFVLHAFTIQNLNGSAVRVPVALRGKMRLAFCGKHAAIFAEFEMTVEAPRAVIC